MGNLEISFSNVFYLISRILKNRWLLSGIILYVISFLSYIFALANLQLDIAYPVAVSGSVILVFFASRFLLKETMTFYQISGIVIIIFGILLLVIK
ncbi:MAG: EamA family transporter [Candidatus Nealsonbacteria bacterium]|nr:EamA family transporter [Candidatus Nealsonbacteria bacterium]